VLSTDVREENPPLVVKEVAKGDLVGLTDGCKFDRIQAKLLQVANVEIPSEVCHQVVECDARRAEEAMIVRADAHFDTVGEEGASRMSSQIVLVAQNFV